MSEHLRIDDHDPIVRSYRRYFQSLKKITVVLLVLVVLAWLVGIPHLQCASYRYAGRNPAGGTPAAEQKTDAWYLSITGWKHVRSQQYGQQGCPYILFIPANDCISICRLKSACRFRIHKEK